MNFRNFTGHLKTVCAHKRWVFYYCNMCGLTWQGIVHDISKFSPAEFFESVKYYQGNRSPIDACKEANGYSLAWFHHKGANKHHWEYWVDDFEKGVIPKKMPFKYVLEMLCDFLGAGRAYEGKSFSIQSEYKWWQKKRQVALFHKETLGLMDELFDACLNRGIEDTLRDKEYIKEAKENYENGYYKES